MSNPLLSLINYSKSLDSISKELKQIGWDTDYSFKFTKVQLLNILEKYNSSEITSDELERWANLIEGREDIEYENETLISEIIYRLANPILEGVINKQLVNKMIGQLRNNSFN